MSAINTNAFTIFETSHILPNYLLVSKTWPPMTSTLNHKILSCSTFWSYEQWLTCYWVIVSERLVYLFPHIFSPCQHGSPSVSRVLCIMSIEVANVVCYLKVTAPSKILHYRLGWCSMLLLAHNRVRCNNWIFLLISTCCRESTFAQKLCLLK